MKGWIPVKPKKIIFRRPLAYKISGGRSWQSRWLKRKPRNQAVTKPNNKSWIPDQKVIVVRMLS